MHCDCKYCLTAANSNTESPGNNVTMLDFTAIQLDGFHATALWISPNNRRDEGLCTFKTHFRASCAKMKFKQRSLQTLFLFLLLPNDDVN